VPSGIVFLINAPPAYATRESELSAPIEHRHSARKNSQVFINDSEQLLSGAETVLRLFYDALVKNLINNPGMSRLLCKRPGFGFGMGCRGRVSLPLPIDVDAFRVVIAQLSPGPASVPATES